MDFVRLTLQDDPYVKLTPDKWLHLGDFFGMASTGKDKLNGDAIGEGE